MESQEFNIKRSNNSLILSKDNEALSISKALDDDIWFSTNKEETSITLRLSSRNYHEWQTYQVFESLMKSIIGKYILEGYQEDTFNRLPKDFINFEDKIIIWHSDSGTDNVLTLHYENCKITITITKDKKAGNHITNAIRIRTSGSEYETFYQEFTEFFRRIWILEHELNKSLEAPTTPVQPPKRQSKLAKLFNPQKKN